MIQNRLVFYSYHLLQGSVIFTGQANSNGLNHIRYLLIECRWAPENVSELLDQLLKCIAMGMTEQETLLGFLIHFKKMEFI